MAGSTVDGRVGRVVVLVDMDCFYCQVEEGLDPRLAGKPVAVVQCGEGGTVIAVNYLARARGITRRMRPERARELCPEVELPRVPSRRGKADTSRYREAGARVARVLETFSDRVERASVDEAYLELTGRDAPTLPGPPLRLPDTKVPGHAGLDAFADAGGDPDLVSAALLVATLRDRVFRETGYRCSAGIARNKTLAKLACGMNKPDGQTLLPDGSVPALFGTLPVGSLRGLGGKLGERVRLETGVVTLGDLAEIPEAELRRTFGDRTGSLSKSVGACKRFNGRDALTDLASLVRWLRALGAEVHERLNEGEPRRPAKLVVSVAGGTDARDAPRSRTVRLRPGRPTDGDSLAFLALSAVLRDGRAFCQTRTVRDGSGIATLEVALVRPVRFLGLSAGDLGESSGAETGVLRYFRATSSGVPNATAPVERAPLSRPPPRDGDIRSPLRRMAEREPAGAACTLCGIRVQVGRESEHADYHSARRLHARLNGTGSRKAGTLERYLERASEF